MQTINTKDVQCIGYNSTVESPSTRTYVYKWWARRVRHAALNGTNRTGNELSNVSARALQNFSFFLYEYRMQGSL